jgi:hypothetical protein
MNYNPPDFDYEPAPVEESIANARQTLALLFHKELDKAPAGNCDDCGKHGYRVHYGRLDLCDDCAHHRWKVAEAA